MLGRELDAGHTESVGHQINERIMRLGQVQVHRVHHLLRGMRAGHRQHAGVHLAHQVAPARTRLGTQTAGHDDLAIFSQRLAYGVQALLDGIVNKAAGVHNDQVRTVEGFGGLVAFCAELREDQLGIGEGFGAAQADKTDARRRFGNGRWGSGKDFAHSLYCLRAGGGRSERPLNAPPAGPFDTLSMSALQSKSREHLLTLLLHLLLHLLA